MERINFYFSEKFENKDWLESAGDTFLALGRKAFGYNLASKKTIAKNDLSNSFYHIDTIKKISHSVKFIFLFLLLLPLSVAISFAGLGLIALSKTHQFKFKYLDMAVLEATPNPPPKPEVNPPPKPEVNPPPKPEVNPPPKPVENPPEVKKNEEVDDEDMIIKDPVQINEAKKERVYPGDLTAEQKASLKAYYATKEDNTEDEYTLVIKSSQFPDLKIEIRRQDLFQSGAEAIVNAANTGLGGGGGIDGATHKIGGGKYSEAHGKLRELYKANYVSGHAAMIQKRRDQKETQNQSCHRCCRTSRKSCF